MENPPRQRQIVDSDAVPIDRGPPSREEIERTLDVAGTLRGCAFTPELQAFCGRRMRVKKRVERFFERR